jgi:hypothetical protein
MGANRNLLWTFALAVLTTGVFIHQVMAGPYDAWDYRSHVRLANEASSEDLTSFPALVRLNAGNFDFSKAKADGSDIRFADRNGTALSYEIEHYDSGGQNAAIWVKVPTVNQNAPVDYMHLFHGNAAAADAQNPPDVWSNGYKGVWHLDSTTGTEPSSTGVHDGTVVVSSGAGPANAPGYIGDGRLFANNGYITARDEDVAAGQSSLDEPDTIAVTFWMQADPGNASYQRNMSKRTGSDFWETQRNGSSNGMSVRIDTSGGFNQVKPIGGSAYDGDWHFAAFSLDAGAWRTRLDGGSNQGGYSHGAGFGNTQDLHMGSFSGGGTPWRGALDEVRFSNVARSAEWLEGQWRTQSGQLSFVTGTRDMTVPTSLIAQYTHEDPSDFNRDDTGHGMDANNRGVSFVPGAATGAYRFDPGDWMGFYARSENDGLDVPADAISPDDSFTFTALVNKNDQLAGGHRTILASERFRFQYRTEGATQTERENNGQLILNINSGGPGAGLPLGSFDIDTWYFTALRYDATGNTVDAFLMPIASALGPEAFSVSPSNPFTGLSAFRIGLDGLSGIGGVDGWDGFIDGARFYNAYLDDAELNGVFRSYTTPEPTTLTLLALGGLGLWRRRRRR